MAEMIRKQIITLVKEVKGKDRVLEFIGTTEGIDRDGEVIKADAWQVDEYTKNPVVQWAHDYSSPPIGKTLSIRRDKKNSTIFEIEFADKETYEFADTIFKLCKGGFLNATSVGFIPLEFDTGKKETDPRRTYTKVELLEVSIVPVPSNPDALVTAREAGLITVKEFEFVTKPEETEDYFRVPVKGESADKHSGHRIRTIDISAEKGIKALYCGECKVVITYLFDKKHDWTMAKAEAWVKEHEKTVSQAQIKDEIDYLSAMFEEAGMTEENKALFLTLTKRVAGSDMPVDIKQAIRDMVAPVIKMMESHHKAHEKWYEGCKSALESMCDLSEQPKGQPPADGESMRDFLREEIIKQLTEVK